MGISASTFWWVVAGIAVAAELSTGTFYLLMIALGLAAAAVAAHLGLSLGPQLLAAALVGGGATTLWHWRRTRHGQEPRIARNRDVNLDVGEHVRVDAWGPDGTARIQYRGAQWQARLEGGHDAAPGEHRIAAVEGNWLVLAPLTKH